MRAPTGDQFVISSGGYTATITESGATLRALSHEGRELVAGFAEDAMPSGGTGQLLVPWPNRIRDGRYTFAGATQQLPLSEPARHNASHGLVRWAAWTPVAVSDESVTLGYRLMAQSGYPWTLDLRTTYAVGPDGLTVTQAATNLAATAAPYASGAHPYLTVGPGPVDDWILALPAATRLLSDPDRKLPTGHESVTDTDYDFREGPAIGPLVLDHAFGDLERDADGVATVTLRGPGGGVALWVDWRHRWLMAYTADDRPNARQVLAVEPMTAPPDAFNSGEDLITLGPDETVEARWGIRVL
ncbi:aldose 1-epimerase family protein [Nocardioides sp. DS6]|uniref:Aldose 1-epimerase family protein n=1 Tax=Nocardioides eburneus TaxID=3231482 RepID=A0ABV3T1Y7_9ACTN